MKKLLLGLCLVFGVEYANAWDRCSSDYKSFHKNMANMKKAMDLGFTDDALRYARLGDYDSRQVMINCMDDSKEFKVVGQFRKEVGDKFKDLK